MKDYAVIQALRYKAGSIPNGVTPIFHWPQNDPGVASASNKKEKLGYLLGWGVKAAGAYGWQP